MFTIYFVQRYLIKRLTRCSDDVKLFSMTVSKFVDYKIVITVLRFDQLFLHKFIYFAFLSFQRVMQWVVQLFVPNIIANSVSRYFLHVIWSYWFFISNNRSQTLALKRLYSSVLFDYICFSFFPNVIEFIFSKRSSNFKASTFSVYFFSAVAFWNKLVLLFA